MEVIDFEIGEASVLTQGGAQAEEVMSVADEV